jgi:hypothetical protein
VYARYTLGNRRCTAPNNSDHVAAKTPFSLTDYAPVTALDVGCWMFPRIAFRIPQSAFSRL